MDIKKAIEYAKVSLRNLLLCDKSILNPEMLESEMWIVYRLYDDEQISKEANKKENV